MEFSLKTKLVTGYGCLKKIGEIVQSFGVKKVLLCTDAFLLQTPAAHTIQRELEERGIGCVVYDQPQSEPTDVQCDEGAKFCKEQEVELIVALGGGSVMDQAKAMSAIVTNGLSCCQLDNVSIPKRMLPLICIPTTAGTGSEVTFVAVITNTKAQYKMTIMDSDHLSPDIALCDPALLATLPPRLIASCGIDALTHAIEAHTSVLANPFSSALALHAMEMISKNLKRCWSSHSDMQAQEAMLLASTMAGAAFINSDVGAVHAIAETVGVAYHIPHGTANSLFLPYVMEFNRRGNEHCYAQIAERLGGAGKDSDDVENSRRAVCFVQELIEKLEIPHFSDFSQVNPDDFEILAERAASNPMSYDNQKPIGKEDYIQILEDAYQNKKIYL